MEDNLNSDQMLDINDDYQQEYLEMKRILQTLNSDLNAMEEKTIELNLEVSLMAQELVQSLESVDSIAAVDQCSDVAKKPTVINENGGSGDGFTANDDCDDNLMTSSQGMGDNIETSQEDYEAENEWLKKKEIVEHFEAIDAKTQDFAQSMRSNNAIAVTDGAEQVVTETTKMDDKVEEDINVKAEKDIGHRNTVIEDIGLGGQALNSY